MNRFWKKMRKFYTNFDVKISVAIFFTTNSQFDQNSMWLKIFNVGFHFFNPEEIRIIRLAVQMKTTIIRSTSSIITPINKSCMKNSSIVSPISNSESTIFFHSITTTFIWNFFLLLLADLVREVCSLMTSDVYGVVSFLYLSVSVI